MSDYVILKPIFKASYCYLWEVIQWRAFGTFPEVYWEYGGNDARLSGKDSNCFDVSIPNDNRELTFLSPEQTQFAGIANDPSFEMFVHERIYNEVGEYDELIIRYQNDLNKASNDDDVNDLEKMIASQILTRGEAVEFWKEYRQWRRAYEEHLDQFQNEFLIHLRKGKIKAKGRKLPHRDKLMTQQVFEAEDYGTIDIEPQEIPSEFWVSKYVNWPDCMLQTPDSCFVWISVDVNDMLEIFPPSDLIPNNQLHPVGQLYAIAENAVSLPQSPTSDRRGRPPLPWQDFYVEVARQYRDGTMPDKKEAAIQFFLDWFKAAKRLEVSRSAVGEKLKPFFDVLKE